MNNPSKFLKVACIQMCSSIDLEKNLLMAEGFIREAAKDGASLIITPEMTSLLDRKSSRLMQNIKTEAEDLALKHFSKLAEALKIDLVIGSMPIKISEEKAANRSYFINAKGEIQNYYDKLHMFDVELPDGELYRESKNFQAGDRAVLVRSVNYGCVAERVHTYYILGMSICYDLRFPELFRDLALNGAELISVPAAFTVPTGKAHWHTLLRARAIETGSFILAAAQAGEHEDGRQTYGHSLIVNPWGEIIAEKPSGLGFISASLDLDLVKEFRARIPALRHRRAYTVESVFT